LEEAARKRRFNHILRFGLTLRCAGFHSAMRSSILHGIAHEKKCRYVYIPNPDCPDVPGDCADSIHLQCAIVALPRNHH